jgi:hypothetical protein
MQRRPPAGATPAGARALRARHPGRAAACSAAAQVRDLSHQVPCLQRTASRCAAHGMTGMIIKGARHPGRAAACSAAAQVRDLSHQVPCLQRTASGCAAHGMTGLVIKGARHPGRAAACNDAAQVRDLSRKVPCLQRTASRRAAHGMTGLVIKGARHPGRAAACSAAAQVRDLFHEVPCLQRTASRCAAHGMTGMIQPRCAAHGMTGLWFHRRSSVYGARRSRSSPTNIGARARGRINWGINWGISWGITWGMDFFSPLESKAWRSPQKRWLTGPVSRFCSPRRLCSVYGRSTGGGPNQPRHPVRGAACNAAPQTRDLSREVPGLRRITARCGASGMTVGFVGDARGRIEGRCAEQTPFTSPACGRVGARPLTDTPGIRRNRCAGRRHSPCRARWRRRGR